MQQTFQITISGQVQGVGFRPFVHKLAHQFRLKGSVCNNENGVFILVNAANQKAHNFLESILENAPAISKIQSHAIVEVPYQEFDDFTFVVSETDEQVNIPLTPDFAICPSCKAEIIDKTNRRYGYAFTTCTNCGPRYAVTKKFPFERTNTTVSDFAMCHNCISEYENADNRRFHSQTNTCKECGVRLQLTDSAGNVLEIRQEEIVQKVAQLILEGRIVAIKNTNGYLLCCDANNKVAIERLREKKQRPTKPFALLYPSLEQIKKSFEVSKVEEKALLSSIAPIVILRPNKVIGGIECDTIAPGLQQLGVMLPSSALLYLLANSLNVPIIATSGNIYGSPIISEEAKAVEKLLGVADCFLHHDLKISFPQDDSVLRFTNKQQITLRRSRGLAPNYMEAKVLGDETILAMGAHLKSTFCFVPNSNVYVSPYFGNLDSYDVSVRFNKSLEQFIKLFGAKPKTILIDKHPQYQSSILGKELFQKWDTELVPIQHHKAHFASVLAEHHLFDSPKKVLGVIWDGTGLGDDNAIWGGEFFSYQNSRMERMTHFEYIDWLAADKMAKEPRLSLLSMLPEEGKELVKDQFSEREWKVYTKMLERNNLKTSSVGRLFDAVASLLNLIHITSYEGEAAMLLENLATRYQGSDYIDFLSGEVFETISTKRLLNTVRNALIDGVSKERIANSFIHTLALAILKVASNHKFDCIACSGGVFQNTILIKKLNELAEYQQIELKFNRILSSNDENISFGQFAYYQHIKN